MSEVFGIPFEHVASAELEPAKRAWIVDMLNSMGWPLPQFLYDDMEAIAFCEAANLIDDPKTPVPVRLPLLFLLTIGFGCKSVSGQTLFQTGWCDPTLRRLEVLRE